MIMKIAVFRHLVPRVLVELYGFFNGNVASVIMVQASVIGGGVAGLFGSHGK